MICFHLVYSLSSPASLEWEGIKCWTKFLRILQYQSCILQTRIKSPKRCIVLGLRGSIKYFFAQNSRRGWRKPANARGFTFQKNAKLELLRASIVVTYYIKLFHTRDDRQNVILMSLLLLVAEIKNINQRYVNHKNRIHNS